MTVALRSQVFADVQPGRTTKAAVMNAITDAFNKGTDTVILYYSGHGRRDDGAWCFETATEGDFEFINYDDVRQLWEQAPGRRPLAQLLIISDSCYSGCWVEEAKARGYGIYVQAACGAHEQSADTKDGGIFTNHFLGTTRVRTREEYGTGFWWKAIVAYVVSPILIIQTTGKSIAGRFQTFCPVANGTANWAHYRVGRHQIMFTQGWFQLPQWFETIAPP